MTVVRSGPQEAWRQLAEMHVEDMNATGTLARALLTLLDHNPVVSYAVGGWCIKCRGDGLVKCDDGKVWCSHCGAGPLDMAMIGVPEGEKVSNEPRQ